MSKGHYLQSRKKVWDVGLNGEQENDIYVGIST